LATRQSAETRKPKGLRLQFAVCILLKELRIARPDAAQRNSDLALKLDIGWDMAGV
jgi:hypothetical protein